MSQPLSLFHYTTIPGICGIIGTKCLWATSIRHLNDASEFTYAHDVLRKTLENTTKGASADIRAAAEYMVGALDMSRTSNTLNLLGKFGTTFVVSLSSEPDRLSQWRAYSPGGGYALGFRVEALHALAKHYGFSLLRCSYDEKQHRQEANAITERVLAKFSELPQEVRVAIEPGGSESPRATQSWLFSMRRDMLEDIQRSAAVWKHPSFEEEAEWRLISDQQLDRVVKFRPGRTAIIPYTELNLTEPEANQISGMTAVLSHIVVSPCAEPELAVGSLQHLLEAQRLSCPQISLSSIPYRHW
jgi:Protein of unknown function (DUF2971)